MHHGLRRDRSVAARAAVDASGPGRPIASGHIDRRSLLAAAALLPWLSACSNPLPLVRVPATDASASARLRASAQAHGLDAYRRLTDINLSYAGEWRPLIGRIQPEIVDAGFRAGSQERLMPALGISAQAYAGPSGDKFVRWRRGAAGSARPGEVAVWFNGERSTDDAALKAAALVADCYHLFLLGPLWLVDRGLDMAQAGTEQVDGRLCDVVDVWLTPGLGQVANDRVAVCIDRVDGLTRRVRFTLEGTEKSQGAVAEVDTFDHRRLFGVAWPMRSHERVVHPFRLPAHDWHITGLDVNRGYAPQALNGPRLEGAAGTPARPIDPADAGG